MSKDKKRVVEIDKDWFLESIRKWGECLDLHGTPVVFVHRVGTELSQAQRSATLQRKAERKRWER